MSSEPRTNYKIYLSSVNNVDTCHFENPDRQEGIGRADRTVQHSSGFGFDNAARLRQLIASMRTRSTWIDLLALLIMGAAGCTVTAPNVSNTPSRPSVYEDVSSSGRVQGAGVESQDIVTVTDQMVRDMLTSPELANQQPRPRVIIDSEYFSNESTTRVNVNMITDRLRVELNRAAKGRMSFIARHYGDMGDRERALKRSGKVDKGTQGMTAKPAGGDYRLGGRISSRDALNTRTNTASNYHQIVFEMIDLETDEIVWSGMYEFKKTAADDVLYN